MLIPKEYDVPSIRAILSVSSCKLRIDIRSINLYIAMDTGGLSKYTALQIIDAEMPHLTDLIMCWVYSSSTYFHHTYGWKEENVHVITSGCCITGVVILPETVMYL